MWFLSLSNKLNSITYLTLLRLLGKTILWSSHENGISMKILATNSVNHKA